MAPPAILVVEDELLIARDIASRVKSLGYAVSGVAASGEEALACVEAAPPDLVLMDIVLRGGMDGIETAGRIRLRWDIPVVYLTAYKDEKTLERAKAGGLYGYVLKPIHDAELRIAIELALFKHQMEMGLRQSEERLALALEGGELAAWDWDISTGEITCDTRWRVMFGYGTEPPPRGLDFWSERTHPEDTERVLEAVQAHLAGQTRLYESAHRVRAHGGQWRWIQDLGKVVERAQDGRPLRMAGVQRDITAARTLEAERMRLEERAREAERLEFLRVMTGGVTHEFKNLLYVIQSSAEQGMRQCAPDAAAWRHFEQIQYAARRAAEISNQIVNYADRRVVCLAPVDLSAVARESVELLVSALKGDVALESRLMPDLPLIDADRVDILQLIQNLVTNAAEAIGEGPGAIVLKTGIEICGPDTREWAYAPADLEPGERVFIEVSDTGPDIGDTARKQIFDPLYSTKFTGRGLGLPVVLGIARRHRAAIAVDSPAGSGVSFRVYFRKSRHPACAGKPETTSAASSQETAFGSGTPILVIDAEDVVLQLCHRVLSHYGIQVLTCGSIDAALAALHEMAGAVEAIVLDLNVPGATDPQCVNALREGREEIPIIATCGYPPGDIAGRIQALGIKEYIQKPYEFADLVQLIRSYARL